MSNSKTVCIIEDNMPIRKLFSTLLQKNGFNVFGFDNALDGIEWLKLNVPSVIVMDILLPGLSGQEAIKIIRELPGFENVPVVAVTGLTTFTERDKLLGSGFNHYMTKPVDVVTFAQEIINCIQ